VARQHFALAALWQPSEPEYRWRMALADLAAFGPEAYRRTLLPLSEGQRGVDDLEVPWRLSAVLAAGWQIAATPANLAGLSAAEAALHHQAARRGAKAVALARLCGYQKKLYAAAARLCCYAFTADPGLAETQDEGMAGRYDAACFVALAAAGQGQDAAALGEVECARLRQQAHQWLRADLAHWSKTLDEGKPAGTAQVRLQMQHWQYDYDLASMRDRAALGTLPEGERRLWEQLWADVAALLARAGRAK
jgi:hypothetical protein